MKTMSIVASGLCVLALIGCSKKGDGNVVEHVPSFPHTDPISTPLPLSSFDLVSETDWDETAVQKVLYTFAYGGFASESQISTWADMSPEVAIFEMLHFSPINEKLSPSDSYDELDNTSGELSYLRQLWYGYSGYNKSEDDNKDNFDLDRTYSPEQTWISAANKRGLNPVRQRIALWETNDHLAVNQDVGVENRQIFKYYDQIAGSLHEGTAYQDILADAAASAAVAVQYNHRENQYVDGSFEGNEDFAREFHQLFFGILGDDGNDANDDAEQTHELTNIRNTALILTDMSVEDVPGEDYLADEVTFGTTYHYNSAPMVLGQTISGGDAQLKLSTLAQLAINNSESLNNLPVKIVAGLADDNLTQTKIDQVVAIWDALSEKELLTFLRAYAVSTAFHSEDRVKYQNSVNRAVTIANLMTLDNRESYAEYYNPGDTIRDEDVHLFYPMHNVFGGQKGLENANSAAIFTNAYENSARNYSYYTDVSDDGRDWLKDWASVISANSSDQYTVEDVGEWLWNRFIADDLKNFGVLEQAQVYALLASGSDFSYLFNPDDAEAVHTAVELSGGDLQKQNKLVEIAGALVYLDSSDADIREEANERVGQAIAFITATPFIFAQEGK